MTVADQLGFGPTRTITNNEDGTYTITVVPPKWAHCGDGASIRLTAEQMVGYQQWREGALIQKALPHLSNHEREILMTGIGPELFSKLFPEEE